MLDLYTLLFSILAFIFGSAVGSFINVLLLRIPEKKNVVSDRSECPECHHELQAKDLVPLLSFLFLKGKCRYCKTKISWRYPLMEISVGLLFLGTFLKYGRLADMLVSPFLDIPFVLFIIYTLVILMLLFSILIIDLKTYRIPNLLIFPMITIGFLAEPIWALLKFKHGPVILHQFLFELQYIFKSLLRFDDYNYVFLPDIPGWLVPLFSAVVIFSLLLVLHLVTKGKGMGFGDVKLGFFMGLFLGWPNSFLALYLAFGLGAVVSLLLMVVHRKGFKDRIPFGPFLVLGTIAALFFF